MRELKQVVAAVFKLKGKPNLSEKELVNTLSYDLRWFSPNEARQIIAACRSEKIISGASDAVSPSFDAFGMEVPPDFKPDKGLLAHRVRESNYQRIVEKVSKDSKLSAEQINAEIASMRSAFFATDEVIALVVARAHGVDVSEFLDDVEKGLRKQ